LLVSSFIPCTDSAQVLVYIVRDSAIKVCVYIYNYINAGILLAVKDLKNELLNQLSGRASIQATDNTFASSFTFGKFFSCYD
jgi:hypothetical protein